MKSIGFFFSTILVFASNAYAISVDQFPTLEGTVMPEPSSSIISAGYIVQLIFSLLVVLGFIYVAAKYVLPKITPSTKGKILEVVDKVVLESQVTSYVIKAGKSSWLIVVSSKSIAKIDKLEGDLDNP